jgi:predicted transcriptional regulator YdeE
LENLQGLGYKWDGNTISYAIGLKNEDIQEYNLSIELPVSGWITVEGETDHLKEIYEEIYKEGQLKYEIETFYENGKCQIKYYR